MFIYIYIINQRMFIEAVGDNNNSYIHIHIDAQEHD